MVVVLGSLRNRVNTVNGIIKSWWQWVQFFLCYYYDKNQPSENYATCNNPFYYMEPDQCLIKEPVYNYLPIGRARINQGRSKQLRPIVLSGTKRLHLDKILQRSHLRLPGQTSFKSGAILQRFPSLSAKVSSDDLKHKRAGSTPLRYQSSSTTLLR